MRVGWTGGVQEITRRLLSRQGVTHSHPAGDRYEKKSKGNNKAPRQRIRREKLSTVFQGEGRQISLGAAFWGKLIPGVWGVEIGGQGACTSETLHRDADGWTW
jgi:hypothetical protein